LSRKIAIIVGPTGIGKSQVALKLAQRINAEIIVADSMQIYRYMDIGTAKPTDEERALIPHHLVDIVDPDDGFSAGRFRSMAQRAIASIHEKDKNVLLCGGTGLYIKALIRGLFSESEGNEILRRELRDQEARHGEGYLFEQLKKVDPASAACIHSHDIFRIIRALEIYQLTGMPISHHHAGHKFQEFEYEYMQIGLQMDRELLYDRIDRRCDQMIADGFVEEVESLLARGYHSELKSMQSLGYRHFCSSLKGELRFEEALTNMKRDTRRYAKRQLTWFKKDSSIIWMTDPLKLIGHVEGLVKKFFSS